MTGHAILQIVKGVQKVPGDNFSAEQGLDVIDFLDTTGGFALDAYEMKIPSLKSSAVYADSPLTDGRTLISGTLGNVTETIRVTLTAGTIVQLSAMLSKLLRFKQDCNDFWDTYNQIEPVYIKHQVSGEPGTRYALLYDIDIAIDSLTNPSEPTRDLTIVIEREYGWRGLAPGDNPKKWALEQRGVKLNAANATLWQPNAQPQLAEYLLGLNRLTWNAARTSPSARNYIEIPANAIPGDLPALAYLSLDIGQGTGATDDTLIVWRHSKPLSLTARNGTTKYFSPLLNASEASLQTDATTAADTGASTGSRVRVTFATPALVSRLQFSQNSTAYILPNLFRGRYHVFLRARVSAAANITLQLVGYTGNTAIEYPTATLSSLGGGGTGNTTSWVLVDLGVVNLPSINKAYSAIDGLGLNLTTSFIETFFAVHAGRNSGAGELYINDLIFVGIDETAALFQSDSSNSINNRVVTFDNTGYTQHGGTDDVAIYGNDNLATSFTSGALNYKGAPILLQPKVANRLYFLTYSDSTKFTDVSNNYEIRVNIVPRWSALRDTK